MSDQLRRAFERYEDEIINDEREGLISTEHARQLYRDLALDYRNAAEDAAEKAKERELEEWW